MTAKSMVLKLKPSLDEATKPSELIQIEGHQNLSLQARRAITILWHNAHRQGIEEGRDYTISLADLRTDRKQSSHGIDECIVQLMKSILQVRLQDGKTRRVQFLGGNDMDDPDRIEGTLSYSFDKRLVEILKDSYIWGRIAIPVLMAFSSKYAVSLYENVAQLSGLDHKTFEDYSLDGFRRMIGVEDGKYRRFGEFNKHVVRPAVSEINALAPFNVQIIPIKTGKRVTEIRVGWWPKNEQELREAYAETNRPKIGRKARISGRAEYVTPALPNETEQARLARSPARRALNSSPLIDES